MPFTTTIVGSDMQPPDRATVEARWLELTRTLLPTVAAARNWPVRADHCFQRIFLDNACHGIWYDHIARAPAYANADRAILDSAVALAEQALAGEIDLGELNRRSLAWRRRGAGRTG